MRQAEERMGPPVTWGGIAMDSAVQGKAGIQDRSFASRAKP